MKRQTLATGEPPPPTPTDAFAAHYPPGQIADLEGQLRNMALAGRVSDVLPLRTRLVGLVFQDSTWPIGSFLAATRVVELLRMAALRAEALALLEALQKELQDDRRPPVLRARLWHELGRAFLPLARYDDTLKAGESAWELLKALPQERVLAALVQNSLGIAHWRKSEIGVARELLQASLATLETLAPQTVFHANALHDITLVPDHQDPESAYRRLLLADEIYTKLNIVTPGRISVMNSLGHFFWGKGDLATSKRYLHTALALVEPGTRQGDLHTVLGNVCLQGGERKAAREHFEAARALYETFAPDTFFMGRAFSNLGSLEQTEGNQLLARQHFEKALASYRLYKPFSIEEANACRNLGSTLEQIGDLADADKHYRESLAMVERLDTPNYQRVNAVAQTARFWMRHKRYDEAIGLLTPFAAFLESFLPLYRSEVLRPLAGRDVAGIYVELLRCYVANGDTAMAYYVQERLRAYDLVHLSAQSTQRNKPPLLPATQIRLASIDAEIRQKLKALDGLRTAPEKDTCRRELDRLIMHHAEALKRDLRNPLEPFSLAQAQRLLEPGTLLLSYTLFGETLTICGVTRSSVRIHQVPTAKIPEQAHAFWEAVTSHSKKYSARQVRPPEELATGLYKTLIAPFEREIAAAQRLLLSPDGALHDVPFAALKSPAGFLGHRLPLAYMPSMTFAALINKQSASKLGVLSLVYADPELPPRPSTQEAMIAAERAGLPTKRLPGSRKEGIAVAKSLHTQCVMDKEATLAQFRRDAQSAKVIHIASHAWGNVADPLASWILFSPEGESDFQLRAWELYARTVTLKATHVTLSACETSLGPAVEREGALSLARAFLAAGASSVLGSLWWAHDAATSLFMQTFYQTLQRGERRDKAMMLATKEVAQQGQWEHPYYWAAFQLTGESGVLG